MCPSSWGHLHLSLCLGFVCLILLSRSEAALVCSRGSQMPSSLFYSRKKAETTLSFNELLNLSAPDKSQLRFQSCYLLRQEKGRSPDWIFELRYNRRNNDARTWSLEASCKLSTHRVVGDQNKHYSLCILFLDVLIFFFSLLQLLLIPPYPSFYIWFLFYLFLNKTSFHGRSQ